MLRQPRETVPARVVVGADVTRRCLAILAAFVLFAPAAQAQTKIQPGAMLQTDAGQCTLNFVYDGLGRNAGKVDMRGVVILIGH